MVSLWNFNEYELIPASRCATTSSIFDGCAHLTDNGDLCVTLKHLPLARSSSACWSGRITLVLGFTVAYFLAFHVRSPGMQTVLFVLCTVPFWTSNVIRMISWVPLLGRNGLVNQGAAWAWAWSTSRSSGCCSPTSRWCWPSCTSTRCS